MFLFLQKLVDTHCLKDFRILQSTGAEMERQRWQSCLAGSLVEVKFKIQDKANGELHMSLIEVVTLDK